LYDYEAGRASYLIDSQSLVNTSIKSYYNNVEVKSINITNKTAKVDLVLHQNIDYSFLTETFVNDIPHQINLSNVNENWVITDDQYTDTLKELYGIGTDFVSLGSDLKVIEKTRIENAKQLNATQTSSSVQIVPYSIPGDTWDIYNSTKRANAVSYARAHTDSTNTTATTYYNTSQFKTYGDTDCQNFVSQAIWYGFGGRSSANKDYPMDSTSWWANTTGETTTWNWTGTSYFHNWITSNSANNSYGIQGTSYTSPGFVRAGDYIYVPGHVMFVTTAATSGTTAYSSIYISAHTNNQLDKNLQALYGGGAAPSNMEFMVINGNKWWNPNG
jgi:hypothetical protein